MRPRDAAYLLARQIAAYLLARQIAELGLAGLMAVATALLAAGAILAVLSGAC